MYNFGMPYMNNPSAQSLDMIIQETQNRLDNFKQQRDQLFQNVPQATNLTQNFQLAPNGAGNFRLVKDANDVQKEIVLADTYFLANTLDGLWIKNARGDIRTFQVIELKPKDEKDLLIEDLQRQIEELKGGNVNASTNEFNESNGDQLSKQPITNVFGANGNEIKTSEPSNVPDISNSKTAKRKS